MPSLNIISLQKKTLFRDQFLVTKWNGCVTKIVTKLNVGY